MGNNIFWMVAHELTGGGAFSPADFKQLFEGGKASFFCNSIVSDGGVSVSGIC